MKLVHNFAIFALVLIQSLIVTHYSNVWVGISCALFATAHNLLGFIEGRTK